MTRADLTIEVARQLGGSKKAAAAAIDAVFEGIKVGLEKDDKVSINSFGVFYNQTVPAHTSRNPKTGEAVNVPEKKRPKLRYSKQVKDLMNSN